MNLHWLSALLASAPTAVPGHGRTSTRSTVAIIGYSGYIGSMLQSSLVEEGYRVTGFARHSYAIANTSASLTTRLVAALDDTEYLQSFDAVIYLGGVTSRREATALSEAELHERNVLPILSIASRMNRRQVLLFASTAAISDGLGADAASEDEAVDRSRLDAYALSYYRRELQLNKVAQSPGSPRIIGLRFATVAGLSAGQRIDLSFQKFFRDAYSTGQLSLTESFTWRSVLWMGDLERSIRKILHHAARAGGRFEIFNLASFQTTTAGIANAIAQRTGAHIDVQPQPATQSNLGFVLNTSKFKQRYGDVFLGSLQQCVSLAYDHVTESISPKGAHAPQDVTHAMPCPVCGAKHQQEVLDLHTQPLANDFRPTAAGAMSAPRYPLKLVRCRECNHMHITQTLPGEALFSVYLYASGTNQRILRYFEWFAAKVDAECQASGSQPKAVLEIACNDGSQLDFFQRLGWKTYGVDPAKPIAERAVRKGHNVNITFWQSGVWPKNAPRLDAIVAQNVFAHVTTPVSFLAACVDAMDDRTRLYIQTSQCNMHQDNQFDTVYHEHVSFFTAHSFQRAADLSGLRIVDFSLADIHGTSCLVTMMRQRTTDAADHVEQVAPALQSRLNLEVKQGLTQDFFYERYEARADVIRRWLIRQLVGVQQSGYHLAAYGAAAKGTVLLNFLRADHESRAFNLSFVVDDAPLKQKLFSPGLGVPVIDTQQLRDRVDSRPLALLICAWNFFDEIAHRVSAALRSHPHQLILFIIPFPTSRVLACLASECGRQDARVLVKELSMHAPEWPDTGADILKSTVRRRVFLVSIFTEKSKVLPGWIRNHAPHFDSAFIFVTESAKAHVRSLQREIPPEWVLMQASDSLLRVGQLGCSDAAILCTNANMAWYLFLNPDEFLITTNFRASLAARGEQSINIRVLQGTDDWPTQGSVRSIKTLRYLSIKSPHKRPSRLVRVGWSSYAHEARGAAPLGAGNVSGLHTEAVIYQSRKGRSIRKDGDHDLMVVPVSNDSKDEHGMWARVVHSAVDPIHPRFEVLPHQPQRLNVMIPNSRIFEFALPPSSRYLTWPCTTGPSTPLITVVILPHPSKANRLTAHANTVATVSRQSIAHHIVTKVLLPSLAEGGSELCDERSVCEVGLETPYVTFLQASDELEFTHLEKALSALRSFGGQYANGLHVHAEDAKISYFHDLKTLPHSTLLSGALFYSKELLKSDRILKVNLQATHVLWEQLAGLSPGNIIPELTVWHSHALHENQSRSDCNHLPEGRKLLGGLGCQYGVGEAMVVHESKPGRRVDTSLFFAAKSKWCNHVEDRPRGTYPTCPKGALLIIPWLTVGGLEELAILVASTLNQMGYQLTVVCTSTMWTGAENATDGTPSRGIPSWEFLPRLLSITQDVHFMHNFLPETSFAQYVAQLVESRAVELIFLQHSIVGYCILPFITKAASSRNRSYSVIDYIHTTNNYGAVAPCCDIKERRSIFLAVSTARRQYIDVTLTGTAFIKQRLCNQSRDNCDRTSIVRYPVQLEPPREDERRVESPGLRILWFSRLHPAKRPILALNLFKSFCDHLNQVQRESVHLTIMGTGPLEAQVRESIRSLGLQDVTSLVVAPSPESRRAAMLSADVMLQTNAVEGITMVSIEALTMGVITVVMNDKHHSSVQEVEPYLVGDTDMAVVEHLQRLLEMDGPLRSRLRSKAMLYTDRHGFTMSGFRSNLATAISNAELAAPLRRSAGFSSSFESACVDRSSCASGSKIPLS